MPQEFSIYFDDDEASSPVLLKYSSSKNIFLARLSLYFLLAYIPPVLTCIYILYDIDFARVYYRQFFINYAFFYLLGTSVGIKLVMGLFGYKFTGRKDEKIFFLFSLGNLAPLLFIIDCALHLVVWMGWYFEIDNFITTLYIYNGHYLIIFTFNIFVSFFLFFFSTLKRNGGSVYDMIGGLVIMAIGNVVTTKTIQGLWTTINVCNSRYTQIILALIVFDAYIVYNSYKVINCRINKFYEHEFIYCYYCYYTDLIFSIPFDGRKSTTIEPSNKKETGINTADIEKDQSKHGKTSAQ